APTLDTIGDLVIDEDAGLQTVNLTGIGAGAANENQVLAVTAGAGVPTLISNLAISYSSPNNNGTLSFAPSPATHGTTVITVYVNDGGVQNSMVSRSFTVVVRPKPPAFIT